MSRLHSSFLLLLVAIMWGAGNASQKALLADIGPFTAVGLRCLIAALVVLPFAQTDRRQSPPSQERRLLTLVTIGCFGFAVTLYQMSFESTTVTNSGFLVNTCAVMTPIAAWWILRKPPPTIIWPAAAAAILGVACMSGSAGVAASWGDAISLLSAMFYALWMVLLGEYVVMHGDVRRFSFVQFAAVGIVASLLGVILEPISMDGLWRAAPHLLFVGAISTGFGYLLQAVAQQRAQACECAIITSSEAIFGAIGGYLMFGERLGVAGFIGAAFILLAIIVVELAPRLQARFATIRPVEDDWQIVDQ